MLATRPCILNVDDFDDGRFVKSEILRMAGFQVIEAATGKEALKQVASEQPDLVLLDVKLPDINGFEVCRRIKKLRGFAPMVLQISMAYNLVENQTEGLDSGADAYLVGPVEPELLVANVKALLRMQKAEQEVRDAGREWQATFDAINDGVALVDKDGVVVRHNEAFIKFVKQLLSDGSFVGGSIEQALAIDATEPGSFPHIRTSRSLIREIAEYKVGERWIRVIADPILKDGQELHKFVVTFRDFTARKLAELERARLLLSEQHAKQKAEENERLFRTTAETMHQLVITTDGSGVAEYCNRRWIQQTGVKSEALVGKSWLDVVECDNPDEVRAVWMRSIETSETFEHEVRIRTIDKEKRWYICRALPELDDRGRCLSWVVTFTDIHDAKTRTRNNLMLASATELLSKSLDYKENLDAVLKLLVPEFIDHAAVHVVSTEGEVVLAAASFDGVAVNALFIEKVVATGLAMILDVAATHKTSLQLKTAVLIPLLARGKTIGVVCFSHVADREREGDKLEALHLFAERLATVIDNSGLYFEAQRELAERKRVERELRESEQRLRVTTESMPQMVWSANAKGEIEYMNNQWYEFTGHKDGEVTLDSQYVHEDDREIVRRGWVTSVRTEERFELEFRLRREVDHAYLWHLARAVPVHDASGHVQRWIGTLTNVDDKRRAQEQTQFLSDASQILMNCLDMSSVIRRVRDFIVPAYADWLSIDMVDDDGVFRRLLSAHHVPEKLQLLQRIYEEFPSPKNVEYGYPRVLKTGRSQLISPLTKSVIEAAATHPIHREILHQSGMKSMMCIPLITRGRTIGCLTAAVTENRRLFDQQDLILLESLAHRIAITIDNVQLMADLQKSLIDAGT